MTQVNTTNVITQLEIKTSDVLDAYLWELARLFSVLQQYSALSESHSIILDKIERLIQSQDLFLNNVTPIYRITSGGDTR